MKLLSVLCASLLCTAAISQTLVGLKVDKSQVLASQPVQASMAFDIQNSVNCGIRLDWGDGSGEDIKVEDAQKIPVIRSHAYVRAGDYTVAVTPKKVTSRLGCLGKAQSAMVKVAAPASIAAATVPVPAVKAVAKLCPDGWKLNPKSANKKTKAFSCTAKPGTALPEKKLACEGATGYFENARKGMIGCQA